MRDTEDDRELIERIHDAWLRAEREGRHGDVLMLCADEIVIQPPIGAPAVGRRAVGDFLRRSSRTLDELTVSDLVIEVSGSLAVKRARFVTKPRGQRQAVSGNHLWLLRPRWKVAFVTWSLDAPPA